jgi:hypothetical protein
MPFTGRQPRLLGSSLWIGAAVALLIQGSGWIGLGKPAERQDRQEPANWKTGSPMPIGVREGKARFRVPTPSPRSEVLVVVSALARSRGPYPVRLAVRPADESSPILVADDGPRRAPGLLATRRVLSPRPAASSRPPSPRRLFHLMVKDGDVASASNYTAVQGVLKGVGLRVQVYVAPEDETAVSSDTIRDVIASFDDRIYPVAAKRFGTADDVDGDGRFTVLISSWLSHLGGGRYSVDGFVRVADMDPAFHSPFGNHCDMMYLSSDLKPGAHLRTIMAHEYMHAVAYSRKSHTRPACRGCPIEEEGWLDEAMAHLAEDVHGFSTSNIDYRVRAFLNQPERYQLVVDDYYAADLFRSHGNRGSTYLFLRWCADRYGPELLPALADCPLRGIANLEATTGATFAGLFRLWSVALYSEEQSTNRNTGDRCLCGGDPAFDGFCTTRDDRELAGPHFERMTPGSPANEWSAQGTTAHYVVVDGVRSPYVEIDVSGSREAELQVTAVPLGDDRARLDLAIETRSTRNEGLAIRARVSERHGAAVRLAGLSWEPETPCPDPTDRTSQRGWLNTERVAAIFGAAEVPGNGELVSGPIPLYGNLARRGPLVVKIVGTDANGRRVVGWARIDTDSAGMDSGF